MQEEESHVPSDAEGKGGGCRRSGLRRLEVAAQESQGRSTKRLSLTPAPCPAGHPRHRGVSVSPEAEVTPQGGDALLAPSPQTPAHCLLR